MNEINYLAVLVAALATFMLAGLWYSALFGKLWARLQGFSDAQVAELKAKMSPPKFFGGMIASYFVLALVMAALVAAFNITTALGGAGLGMLLWLGPAAAIGMTGHLATGKPIGAYLIDVSFQFIYLVMMGAIIAAWR